MIPRDFLARQKPYAVYTFAGQPGLHTLAHKSASAVRNGQLPGFLNSPRDLDFLDPANPFFHTDRVLFSAGPFIHKAQTPPGMFSKRAGVTTLLDSGGFQLIAAPHLWRGDATRAWVLQWLEANGDEAMTLDIPTNGIRPDSPFNSFDIALQTTIDSLAYFAEHQTGVTRFLNVQQGDDAKQAMQWYNATKVYPFGGWAFGGNMRFDFIHLVRLFERMRADGVLDKPRNRVHVLGTATLGMAVMLTALQKGLREWLADDDFLITFDTSTPNKLLITGDVYGFPAMDGTTFNVPQFKPPSHSVVQGSTAKLPMYSSAIGSYLTAGDLCRPKISVAQSAWDSLSDAMIVNHNVHSLLAAIRMANEVMELNARDAAQYAPGYLINAYGAVQVAFQKPDPVAYLRRYAADLKLAAR